METELTTLKVEGNNYTVLTTADVKRMHAEIVAKLAARKGAIKEDVARHLDNDKAASQFAVLVRNLTHALSDSLVGLIKTTVSLPLMVL